jgi:hypothetical protein
VSLEVGDHLYPVNMFKGIGVRNNTNRHLSKPLSRLESAFGGLNTNMTPHGGAVPGHGRDGAEKRLLSALW